MRNLVILLCFSACSGKLLAQQIVTFGADQQITLEFVEIGDPGNADDQFVLSGYSLEQQTVPVLLPSGGVDYQFGISKFQISLAQFQLVDTEVGIGYSVEDAYRSFIRQEIENTPRAAMPVSASWNEAARFVNWLNESSGYGLAYNFEHQPGDED